MSKFDREAYNRQSARNCFRGTLYASIAGIALGALVSAVIIILWQWLKMHHGD